jgi:hypothetical protein
MLNSSGYDTAISTIRKAYQITLLAPRPVFRLSDINQRTTNHIATGSTVVSSSFMYPNPTIDPVLHFLSWPDLSSKAELNFP